MLSLLVIMLANSSDNSPDIITSAHISSTVSDVTEEANSQMVDLPDNPIDFASLKEINSDIYGWITIADTQIDYPILQAGKGRDDFFYLNHDFERNYLFAGSIYSEKQNELDFSDPVTVLYGHNMLNDSMFGELDKFRDATFFEEHEFFNVYIEGHILTYRIYAAYVYDNRHILNSFDFRDSEVVKSYFEYTLNPTSMTRNIRSDIELTENDKIITLSTCTGNTNTRYLVQGVLYKDEQTK